MHRLKRSLEQRPELLREQRHCRNVPNCLPVLVDYRKQLLEQRPACWQWCLPECWPKCLQWC